MPIIDGKVVRARYTSLKLDELSSVDRPAQPGALALIMKRDDPGGHAAILADLAKYIGEDDGAHTFAEVMHDNKFSQEIWPLVDALTQSIKSIVCDGALTSGERDTKISASIDEFLAAVRAISPETEKRLSGLIAKQKDTGMSKTTEQFEADIAKLESDLVDARAALKMSDEEKDKMKAEMADTKKALAAATDDVISVGGKELRKSEIGDTQFTVAKALADERDMARFEKQADADYSHVAGTAAEKAAVLKAAASMPEETRKSFDAIMLAAEKMAAAGFDRLGTGASPAVEKASTEFMGKVAEIEKRDNIKRSDAFSKARREYPEEFKAYNQQAN